jgi:hypothetical protein
MMHSQSRSPFQRYRDTPHGSRQRNDDLEEQDFEDDDENLGPLEDGAPPPFHNDRPGTYPLGSTLGSLSTGLGVVWRDVNQWSRTTYSSVRDWTADQYISRFGSNRGRRRRRRDPDDRDR